MRPNALYLAETAAVTFGNPAVWIDTLLLVGATGMVGDPSGKSAERNLLTREQLAHNDPGIAPDEINDAVMRAAQDDLKGLIQAPGAGLDLGDAQGQGLREAGCAAQAESRGAAALAGRLLPGILLAALFSGYLVVWALRNPALVPPPFPRHRPSATARLCSRRDLLRLPTHHKETT